MRNEVFCPGLCFPQFFSRPHETNSLYTRLVVDRVSKQPSRTMTTPIAERRREEKEQRRIEIIEAAERVFARQGPEKATMGDVATEARLSRALLYVYFKDKDDLDLAISLRGMEILAAAFEDAVASHETGLDKIMAIGEAYIHFSQTHPFHFNQLARHESREMDLEGGDPTELAYAHTGSRCMDVMAGAIQVGYDDGTINPQLGDPMMVAVTLWGFTHGVIQVATAKGHMLEQRYGLDPEALLRYGLFLAGVALNTPQTG